MDARRTKSWGAASRRELARLLPELRERVSAAVVALQEVGTEPEALAALRGELQRLHGGFLLAGVRELEHLGAELRAAAADLAGVAQAGQVPTQVEVQPLRAALMDAVLCLPRAIERIAVQAEDPVAELASLIDGLRRARGQPRYDSLALLRQCVDPSAPAAQGELAETARASRLAYQRGLLELIRGDERQALGQLRGVLEPLEATLGDSAAGSACWSALAVLDLLEQGEALEPGQKRAIAAYDRELRRLLEQGAAGGLPEPSMAEALLQPLTEAPGTGRVGLVQAAARRLPGATLAMSPPAEDASGAASQVLVRSDVDLQGLFYAEVEPALSQISAALQRWRAGDPEAGLAIQRILHTLQGGARFAGLTELCAHCHELEGEVATALADGATDGTAQRLRHGLEQLAERLGVLRRGVLGSAAEPGGEGAVYDDTGLWLDEDPEEAPAEDAWELQAGSSAQVLGEALAAELADAELAEGDEASARPRVLVVEDSRTMRRILGQQLVRQGLEPEGVASLEEARQAVAERAPRAVLVDLEMARLQHETGLEGLQHLVAEAGLTADAVVAVTTRAVDQERLAAWGLGAARVLLKPYDDAQLAAALAQAGAHPGSGGDGLELPEGQADGGEGDHRGGLGA